VETVRNDERQMTNLEGSGHGALVAAFRVATNRDSRTTVARASKQ